MTDASLTPFFNPQGVAIIGVSRDPTKLGYSMARNLLQSGYPGAVHFVNPKGDHLLGKEIYPSIRVVPDPVDLAVMLVPPPFVPDTLKECGERGIRAVIVATGGFRETGTEGAALEAKCLEIVRSYGMRMVGPNCVGILNTHLPLDTTFLQPPLPPAGEIAFISHSGAICAAVIDWIRHQGFGFSHVISLGNQADINEVDMLAPMAADKHTRVITMYMEGVSNGRRFIEEARQVTKNKPILALKVGRFEAGRKAAASHTGALAGQEAAFEAAFRKAGVIRANQTEEMFQWARALAWCPLPLGRRVGVLTNAGGPGVTAADALEQNGLKLAQFAPQTEAAMQTFLPAAASLRNPVDMLASATPEHYAECLRLLLADPGVDSVLVIAPPPPNSTGGAVAKTVIPVIMVADKPVIVVMMGDRMVTEAVELLRAARVPEYRFPEPAAAALGALTLRSEYLARVSETLLVFTDINKATASELLSKAPSGEFLDPQTAMALLDAYGIRTLKLALATTPDEAATLAEKAGFPVVLKVASPDISHKSDVGGVLLDLKDIAAVKKGFHTVLQNARAAQPGARIEGVHVQRMLPSGQEVIIGMLRDPQFGPLMMFGSGGVEVEGLKDIAIELAPLSQREAEAMLDATWAGRKLKGFRNLPPADRAAAILTLARLAQLALDFPQINEIEINPLRVLPAEEGACAIDVRAKL
jgi:acetyl coenzyme A synthetase (ADP forming)-like protein